MRPVVSLMSGVRAGIRRRRSRWARRAPILRIAVATAVPLLYGSRLFGATTFTWTDNGGLGNGDWSFAIDWSPSGVPGNGDTAILQGGSPITNIVTYDYAGPAVTLNLLHVSAGNSFVTSNVATLNMTANALTATSEIIGDSSGGGSRGRGAINQSGGSNTVTGLLFLGVAPTDFGSYNLTGGALSANGIDVGQGGTGLFNQSGGTTTTGSYLSVGHGGNGTYNFSAGTINITTGLASEYLGDTTSGTFNQSGGVNTCNFTNVGWNPGATGDYELTGGTLSTNQLQVGYQSTGTFNQSAGTANANGLVIGQSAAVNGQYNLSGGSLAVNGTITVGSLGNGTLNQLAGSANANGLIIGQSAGSNGQYNISGGSLTVIGNVSIGSLGNGTMNHSSGTVLLQGGGPLALLVGDGATGIGTYLLSGNAALEGATNSAEVIGNSGNGTFTQSGGTNTLNGDTSSGLALLRLGSAAGATGTYNLTAGSLTLTNTGQEVIGEYGNGTFNQSGGSHTVGSLLILGDAATGVGTYNLTAGNLTTRGLYVPFNGSGVFNQSGGTYTSTDALHLGLGTAGTYNLSAGSLTLSGSGGPAIEYIGFLHAGTFNQSGGNHTVGFVMYLGWLGGAGDYEMSGGTLSAYGIAEGNQTNTSGTFNQSAGTVTLGSFGLFVGMGSGTTGQYTLSGNGVLTAAAQSEEIVGFAGNGTFTQSGGTNNITYTYPFATTTPTDLYIASSSGSTGTYNLTAGSLTLTNAEEAVGVGGNGTFNQSGGSHTITTNITGSAPTLLILGSATGVTGTYNLTGGNLTVSNLSGRTFAFTGLEVVGLNGNGTFTQSGGNNTISSITGSGAALVVGENPGSNGVYTLNGGALSCTDIFVGLAGGNGTFNLNTVNTLTASNGITIFSNGLLEGNGTTSAPVNLEGGRIAPGNVAASFPGTLGVGAVTLNFGSSAYFADIFPGVFGDPRLNVGGNLNLAGPSAIVLYGRFTTPLPLIGYSGTVNGSLNNLVVVGGYVGLAYTPVNDTGNHVITFTSQTVSHHTIIDESGQAAPGAGGGLTAGYAAGGTPSFNNAGQVAFYTSLYGSITNGSDAGVFLGDGHSLIAVARQNLAAPGAGGGTFNAFDSNYLSGPSVNDAGQVVFQCTLSGTSDGSTEGVFRFDPVAGLTALARDTEPIPGFPGQTLGPLVRESFNGAPILGPVNAAGQVAFAATINNATDGSTDGIFIAGGAALVTVARHMQAAPGAGGGAFGSLFGYANGFVMPPAINGSGQVAFVSQLTGTNDGSTVGVFRGDGSTLIAVAREKQALPGGDGGTYGPQFDNFYPPIINDSGQVAFTNDSLTGTLDGSSYGLFRGDGNTTVVIAREKMAAPGAGGGIFSGNTNVHFIQGMNNAGQIAFSTFLANTTDGSDFGWFRGDGATLIPIARAMQIAPGTYGGHFLNSGVTSGLAIGPGGQVAFVASLGGTPDPAMNVGLFIGDGQEIICAALAGQALPTNITDTWSGVLASFSLSPSAVNQYGQIAYSAYPQGGAYVFTPILHWRNPGSGNWDTNTNWTVSIAPAYVHDVFIDPASPLAVTGPAANTSIKSLTLGTGGANVTLQLATGGLHISGSLTLAGAPGAWTSTIDMVKSFMIVGSAPALSDQIKAAATLGTWNGTGGITSSAAQAAATTSTATALGYASGAEFSASSGQTAFFGQSFLPTDTLVRYTLAGDATMDGSVTFADFLALQNNYNKPGDWSQGDWNYDGQVTFADFLILQNNYNKTLPAGPITPAASSATAAPEPASLVVVVCASLLLMRKGRWRVPATIIAQPCAAVRGRVLQPGATRLP